MDRRSFLNYSAAATASFFVRGTFQPAWTQDLRAFIAERCGSHDSGASTGCDA